MSGIRWIGFFFTSLALVLLQVLVIDQIGISRFIHPQIYFLALLGLPVNMKHWVTYVVAFALGMTVDVFVNTPGLHAFVCTLMAFSRYIYLSNFADKDWIASNVRPTLSNTDVLSYLLYSGIFSLLFHFFFFALENLSFAHFDEILLSTLYSSSISVLLILLIQFTFSPIESNE